MLFCVSPPPFFFFFRKEKLVSNSYVAQVILLLLPPVMGLQDHPRGTTIPGLYSKLGRHLTAVIYPQPALQFSNDNLST